MRVDDGEASINPSRSQPRPPHSNTRSMGGDDTMNGIERRYVEDLEEQVDRLIKKINHIQSTKELDYHLERVVSNQFLVFECPVCGREMDIHYRRIRPETLSCNTCETEFNLRITIEAPEKGGELRDAL